MGDGSTGAPYHDEVFDQAAVDRAYSMPWDAPVVPPFPFRFRDLSILTLCYRTDPLAIERLLPPPLERVSDVVLIHIYKMPDVDCVGPVHECNVMVGCRYDTGGGAVEGGFSTGLYLDSDVGVAHGREVHGQPKKLGRLSLDARGDLVVGEVERNGITIITATLPFKQRKADPIEMRRHFDFAENINFKAIPNIDGKPAIRQLTARRLDELEITECWTGPCTVELRPNAQAPVFRLPVLEPLEGFFWKAGFTLVAGRVLHDYLAQRR